MRKLKIHEMAGNEGETSSKAVKVKLRCSCIGAFAVVNLQVAGGQEVSMRRPH